MRDNADSGHGLAAGLLRRARADARLTQARLAELAGTTQSAIAAYAAGAREPTVPVLSRMLAAAGARLELDIAPDPSRYRLTDLALDIAATDAADEARRLRLVFEFLRGAQEDGHPLVLLVGAVPPSTGDVRFDALLAAIAEDLCVHAGEAPPRSVVSYRPACPPVRVLLSRCAGCSWSAWPLRVCCWPPAGGSWLAERPARQRPQRSGTSAVSVVP